MNLTKVILEEYVQVKEIEFNSIKQNQEKTVSTLLEVYENWLNEEATMWENETQITPDKSYQRTHELFTKNGLTTENGNLSLIYAEEDITSFCFAIEKYQKPEDQRSKFFMRTGLFLSCLINTHFERTHTEKEYTLITEHLEEEIQFLGYENNGANIFIKGNAGLYLGDGMKNGFIRMEGNYHYAVSVRLKGGCIHLQNEKRDVLYFAINKKTNILCWNKSQPDDIQKEFEYSYPEETYRGEFVLNGMSYSPDIYEKFMQGESILVKQQFGKIKSVCLQNKKIIVKKIDEKVK